MNPEFADAIAQLPVTERASPPTIEQLRFGFDKFVTEPHQQYFATRLPPESSYVVQDITVPGHDVVRCVTPRVDDGRTLPVLVYIHGGGKCLGTLATDDNYLRCLASELQVVTVNVSYRLAPEHPHPAAFEDCLAALKWVAENAPSVGGDVSKGFLLVGHSAGANLVAVLAHELRDDPFFEGRRLTGQVLREPSVVAADCPDEFKAELKSMEEHPNVPPITRDGMLRLRSMYNAPLDDPRGWALLYPSHKNLPPTYIQVMGMDPLRDDGILYEKMLKKDGVTTKLDLYPGVGHGFHYSWPSLKIAEKIREDLVGGYKWLLGRTE